MKRKAVESSMMSSVGYDPVSEILEIEFNTDHIYQYGEVPQEIYQELMAADSKGRYLHSYILDQYPYVRIR